MSFRPTIADGPHDPVFLAAVMTAAVLLPGTAFAAHVGCFITAILLGMMFMVGIGITSLVKHLLAKYVWKVPRTPWLRMFGITWLELLLGVAVFALVSANFWLTVLIYLPLAAVLNRLLLAKFNAGSAPVTFLRRYGIFLLLPFSLPLSIQIAGVIWSSLTSMISFTEFKV